MNTSVLEITTDNNALCITVGYIYLIAMGCWVLVVACTVGAVGAVRGRLRNLSI